MVNRSVLAVGINVPKEEKNIIKKKLGLSDISLDFASIKDIIFTIVKGEIKVDIKGKDLDRYGNVWIQSGWNTTHMAYLLHLYLKSKKIVHNKTNISITKLSDIFRLASKNIEVPNTFFLNGLKVKEENILDIEKICKMPCIFKTYLGSLGSNVNLIEKREDIKGVIREKRKFNRYFFQEYIPNDFDYRVVIANDKPSSVCKRSRVNDEFRNNVALGAREEFMDIKDVDADVLELAVRAARALKLKWAGVDIVTNKDTGQNFVLEVNRRPGLTVRSSEISAAYKYIIGLVSA